MDLVTVREATLDVLRALDMTTVFGNPGSTELAFLDDWPHDFRYVLGLAESSVVGMADGYAQATASAAFVNLHSAAGLGNALGNIYTAYRNAAPLVITAGQQTRSLLPFEPFLGALRATEFPRPYVKWACEPARAQDVPAAIAQAYYWAMQHPRGPTFVSIPQDDWSAMTVPVRPRRVAWEFGPDTSSIATVATALAASMNPAIVVGAAVDRQGAFNLAVALAERTNAPVYEAPTSNRANFPQDHPLFAGFLAAIPERLSATLAAYDLILVIGAPVFTFHVAGNAEIFSSGVPIYLLTDDPAAVAHGQNITTIVGTMKASLSALLAMLPQTLRVSPYPSCAPEPIRPAVARVAPSDPMQPAFVMQSLAESIGPDTVIVEEAPSHRPAMQRYLPIRKRGGGFYTMASGGLGYGLPAAVGIALARRERVVCLIGDGSAMYSIQALWTAVALELPLTVVVCNNGGYGAMRAFSQLMKTKEPPGTRLPGIAFAGLAAAVGCAGAQVGKASNLAAALSDALRSRGPSLVDVAVDPDAVELY